MNVASVDKTQYVLLNSLIKDTTKIRYYLIFIFFINISAYIDNSKVNLLFSLVNN